MTAVRFILVGIVNTIFGYGFFCVFIFTGIPYPFAVLFATLLGVLFNFKTIGRFVFNHRKSTQKIFAKFVFQYSLLYFLNIALVHLFISAGFNEYFSGALSVLPVAMMSYIMNKHFVFGAQK